MVNPLYLLDTNIISEGVKSKPNAAIIRSLKEKSCLSLIPSPVWQELVYNMHSLSEGNLKELIKDYLMTVVAPNFSVLAFDDKAAWVHAELQAKLEKKGINIPILNLQTASCAIANNMILVTKNTDLYMEICKNSSLQLENWFE